MPQTHLEQVLELVKQRGIMMRQMVWRGLVGEITHQARHIEAPEPARSRVYMDVDADLGEHLELAVVAMRVLKGVFLGLTAIVFHGLTTQLALTVEVAIP